MQYRQKRLANSVRPGHNSRIPMGNPMTQGDLDMKRWMAALLALVLAFALTACNGGKKSASSSDLAASHVEVMAAEKL